MTLLTVADLLLWPDFTGVDEDVLQLLLDAEEAAIEAVLGGPVGSVTEVIDGRLLTFLTLRRRAASVTTVTTLDSGVSTSLATNDYRLAGDRRTIWRLGTGTNPGARWPAGPNSYTTVVYDAEDDELIRKRVQRELVALDLNTSPGSTSEQIGAWMEQQQKSSVWNQRAERAAILATLWPPEEIDFA